MIVQHDELGDGRVQAHALIVIAHAHDRARHQTAGGLVGGRVDHGDLAGGLINDIAPQALQEALSPGHGTGVPGTVLVERPHAHLVDAEGVGAVGGVHVVGRDDVLQGLAHLPVLAPDALPVPGEGRLAVGVVGPFHDLFGGHILAALVLVGVGLNVALVEQAVIGLRGGHHAEVEQDLVPEARVEQVQDRVLHTAHVQVGAAGGIAILGPRPHPIGLVGGIDQRVLIGGVDVTHLVPARARPVGHRIGLTAVLLEAIAQVELNLSPLLGLAQRRLGIGGGVIGVVGARGVVGDLRKLDRQHGLRQGVDAALGVPHDGEGLSPVALTAEEPIAQSVGDGAPPGALGLQPGDHGGLGIILGLPIQADLVIGGVHGKAIARIGTLAQVHTARVVNRTDRLDDVEVVGGGEGPVAVIVSGHGHDGAGAVAHEDVVGHEDRHPLPIDRVDAEQAREHAGLGAILGGALGLGGRGGPGAVGGHSLRGRGSATRPGLAGALGPGGRHCQGSGIGVRSLAERSAQQRVLGGHHHEGRAEERVGPRGVDTQISNGRTDLPSALDGEPHLGALGAADPVALHELDLLGPVDRVQVRGETIGVGSDAHHPLAQIAFEDREVAALRTTIGRDLLIGQNGAQTRAPVHRGGRDVGQAVGVDDLGPLGGAEALPRTAVRSRDLSALQFGDQLAHGPGGSRSPSITAGGIGIEPGVEDLEEDPLSPPHVIGIDGLDGATRVVGKAQAPQLTAHGGDIGLGRDPRVLAGGDGVLLGGQAEGVVAHGVQDVPASHAGETGNDIGGDIAQRMPHMQSLARGVGEHVQQEELLLVSIRPCERAHGIVGVEGALGLPAILPRGLDGLGQGGRVSERRR